MSELYTKDQLRALGDWLASRKDVVTGIQIDEYIDSIEPKAIQSPVVSREATAMEIGDGLRKWREVFGAFLPPTAFDELIFAVKALQLHTHQPVPTGEAEFFEAIDDWAMAFDVLDSVVDRETVFADFDQLMEDLKQTLKPFLASRPTVQSPVVSVPSKRELSDLLKRVESDWGEGWGESTSPSTDLHNDQAEAIHAHLLATTKQSPDMTAVVEALKKLGDFSLEVFPGSNGKPTTWRMYNPHVEGNAIVKDFYTFHELIAHLAAIKGHESS